MIEKLITEIKTFLKKNAPQLTKDQKDRMYRILNSDNPNFEGYGNKHSDIEKYVKKIHTQYDLSYEIAIEIFKNLIQSDIQDEKMAGVFLLNRFKKDFNQQTINIIEEFIPKYYDSWAITDTSMIRMVGPFLAKNGNEKLARNTIERWSKSDYLWVRRASIVIFLKIIMVKKQFNIDDISKFIERMREDPEDYIHKGIGWLLKTCSKYDPEMIFTYLMKNKRSLSRIILRYASEKLSKDKRAQILKK